MFSMEFQQNSANISGNPINTIVLKNQCWYSGTRYLATNSVSRSSCAVNAVLLSSVLAVLLLLLLLMSAASVA